MKIINSIPPKAEKGQRVALDSEFFGQDKKKLHRPHGTFACLTATYDADTVYQIYNEKEIGKFLAALSDAEWIFHNAVYDLRQLRRFTTISPRFIWDTMLVEKSLFGGYYVNFSLKDLARRWLQVVMDKEARDEFEEAESMTEKMKEYAAKDVVYTLRIAMKQKEDYFESIYMTPYLKVDEPMIFPVLDMAGFRVDTALWIEMAEEHEKRGKDIEEELGINTMSGKQVIAEAKNHRLFIKDTQATTLNAYASNPFIAKVLEARKYRKAASTYGTKWMKENVEEDGRVYAGFTITGAETGRMSSQHPNLQQIPVRKISKFRSAFTASDGHVIMIYDVVQQEPCILACESQDAELIRAIRAGEDIHLTVARAVFGDPNMQKSDERRSVGKTINLGTSYGLTEYGLATRLGITEQEAAKFLAQYFARFRGVFSWINMQRQSARNSGYIQTMWKRKIHVNPYDRQWKNNAINAPIQGGAADFTKVWMRKIWELCRKEKIAFPVVAIVHDELVMDVPKNKIKLMEGIVEKAFDSTAKAMYPSVPFKVEREVGRTWGAKNNKEELYEEEEE